jgi:hypothetical protein
MKNQLSFILVLLVIAIVALGCGRLNPFSSDSGSSSNKSIKDTAVDTVVGEKKIGVPECDEVMDAITAELNNPDDDFVTKAVKATILNRIKDGIKESVDKNPNDKVELAKTCKEFKTQFDKYKAEQQAKENE